MADYEIDEIHRIRWEISARFDHDINKLCEYYMKLDEKYRKSGICRILLPARKLHHKSERNHW